MAMVDLGRINNVVTAGDTFNNQPLLAYATTTGGNKTLDVYIPMALSGVSNFTVTRMNLNLRSPKGGFVPSGNFEALSEENITLSTLTVRRNGIIIRLLNTEIWTNMENNMPCAGVVTFSGSFS